MINQNDSAYLRRQLAMGEVVLFTGAGFSSACKSTSGNNLPTGIELAEILWEVAFPGQTFEENDSLGEIFEVAQKQNSNRVRDALNSSLKIDSATIPDWYKPYMHGPWHRVYTTNFDNFWDVAPMIDSEARQFVVVSAIEDEPIPSPSRGEVVHLNGRLDEFPRITFSPKQYGERSISFEKWYSLFIQDIFGHPIIFIGTELDESLLWEYMAQRRQRTNRSGEHRPKSFLVAPSISAPKRALLSELNVIYLEATAEEFSMLVLDDMAAESRTGSSVLNQRRSRPTSTAIIQDVSILRSAPKPPNFDATEFLRGRMPMWHDIQTGFMVERDSDKHLEQVLDDLETSILVVTGTAGSGKTCSLLQAAARLQEQGRRTMWFSASEHSELRHHQLLERIRTTKPDYLFIDDGDAFGRVSGTFIVQASTNNPELKIVVGVRANRIARSGLESRLISATEITIPGLTDSDIELLIDALDSANRLGFLKGKTRKQQQQIFRKNFDRQLLVAMLEATSGKRFEDLIKDECKDLEGPAFDIYATASLVTSLGMATSRDEILLAAQNSGSDSVGQLQSLIDRRLILCNEHGLVRARHRVIAEQSVDYLKSAGHLAHIIEGIVYALATKLGPEHNTFTREHKLLVKLINHETLIHQLSDTQKIRPIYACVEDLLNSDPHYLLQRGSFEVEKGNPNDARNYLAQAKSLAPDDVFVQTEWAYMLMVEACSDLDQGLPSHRQRADEAFAELYDAIETHGERSPYPFHILARQGTKWVTTAGLSNDERAAYLAQILEATRRGMRLHRDSSILRTIEPEVERLYLLTGAKPNDGASRPPVIGSKKT